MTPFLVFSTGILLIFYFHSTFAHVHSHIDCRCPRFTESYSIEGSFSIDLYATLGPVDHIDYSNQCTNVRVTCTSFSPQWDSDGWAVYNGTMTSLLSGAKRIWCGEGAEWNVEMKKGGETQIWTDVSVYCQSYRAK